MFDTLTTAVTETLRDLIVDPEVERKVDAIPNVLSDSGYDAWGFNPEWPKWSLSVVKHIYDKWFRVEVSGIENVPSGRVLLIGNHSGQLPLDGMLIASAMVFECDPPRATRAQVERWFPTLPVLSKFFARNGQVVGTPKNCQKLLENDECILVFPEGITGSGKLFRKRYQLQKFGYGFMRLALRTKTPIVPVAVVGAEETYPAIFNLEPLARLLGFPYFPITPTFPLMGPLGVIPFPSKIRIYFDEPIRFEGDPDEPDEEIDAKVETVRSAIKRMIQYGLETRQSVFK